MSLDLVNAIRATSLPKAKTSFSIFSKHLILNISKTVNFTINLQETNVFLKKKKTFKNIFPKVKG